jgi:hypothetical protein
LRQVFPLLSLLDDRQNSIRHLSRNEGSVVTISHAAGCPPTGSFEPQGLDTHAGRQNAGSLRRGSGRCHEGLLFFSSRDWKVKAVHCPLRRPRFDRRRARLLEIPFRDEQHAQNSARRGDYKNQIANARGRSRPQWRGHTLSHFFRWRWHVISSKRVAEFDQATERARRG